MKDTKDKKNAHHTLAEAHAKLYPHLVPHLHRQPRPIEKQKDTKLFEKQTIEEACGE